MNDSTDPQSSWFTPPLFLALGTALSYCYAYAYERGFCDVFGIPVELIKLDIVRLFVVGSVMLGAVVVCISFYNMLPRSIFDKSTPWMRRLLTTLPFIALVGFLFWMNSDWAFVYVSLFALGGLVYLDLGEKVQIPVRSSARSLSSRLVARLGPWAVKAPVYALYLAFAINGAGRAAAYGKTDFLVPPNSSNLVGLKIYGDTLICAKADLEKREIYPIFSFYPINSEFARSLEMRAIRGMKVMYDPRPR